MNRPYSFSTYYTAAMNNMFAIKLVCTLCCIGAVLSGKAKNAKKGCNNPTNNNNTLVYQVINLPGNVTGLKITSLVINVTEDLFKDIPNLNPELHIIDNNVKVLENDCFRSMEKLKCVRLNSNQIVRIPRMVFSRCKLIEIYLQSNKISEIDDFAFEDSSALSYLDLSNNFLTVVRRSWFKHSPIELLDLSRNRIVQIRSDTFSEIVTLYYLDLSFNHILYIQDRSFSNCRGLGLLGLAGNGLTDTNFLTNSTIEELVLNLNKINKIQLSNTTIVKKISIYPNPLSCACLYKFWETAKTRGIRITSPSKLIAEWRSGYPVCYASEGTVCNNEIDDITVTHHWHFNAVNYDNIGKFKN